MSGYGSERWYRDTSIITEYLTIEKTEHFPAANPMKLVSRLAVAKSERSIPHLGTHLETDPYPLQFNFFGVSCSMRTPDG